MAESLYTTTPSVRTQSRQRTLAQPFSPSTGLEPISDAFGKFFGNALDNLSNTDLKARLREVQVENEREQIQGWKDESLGKPVDPNLSNDDDYLLARERVAASTEVGQYQERVRALKAAAEAAAKAQGEADAYTGERTSQYAGSMTYETTFASNLGKLQGSQAATEYVTQLKSAGVDHDPEASSAESLKKAFGSGLGGDTGPYFNKEFLQEWDKSVRPAIAQFKADRAKQITLLSRDQLASVAGQMIQQSAVTVGDVKALMGQARTLHPGEEAKAYPWMMGVLVDSAYTTPEGTARLSKIIESDGLGPNGESFAKLFPQMAGELQSKLVDKWKAHSSSEGFARYRGAGDSLTDLEIGEGALLPMDQQRARAAEIGQTLMTLVHQFGGYNSEYVGLRNRLEGWYKKNAESVAGLNQYAELLTGKLEWMSQADINKAQPAYLLAKGINPLRSVEEARNAAYLVGRGKLISTEVSGKMSFAMGDFSNPEQQRNAFYFWKGLEEQGLSKEWMQSESRRTFLAVNAAVNATQKDPLEVLARMSANPELRELPEKPEAFKWQKLLGSGKSDVEAYDEARKRMTKSLGTAFGVSSGNVIMSANAEKDLLWNAGANTMTNTTAGLPDPAEQGFADAAKDVAVNYMLLPGAGDKFVLQRRNLPSRTPDGQQVVPPGSAKNPVTGQMEDTNQTFREDAVLLTTMIPGRVGKAKNVFLVAESEARETGAFTVMDGSAPVMFAPGEVLTKQLAGTTWWDKLATGLLKLSEEYKSKKTQIQPDTIQLPTDPDSAAALLRQTLPPGYDLVVNKDSAEEPYLKLVYRFRFKATDSLDSKARAYRNMSVPVPGPLPTDDQLRNTGP